MINSVGQPKVQAKKQNQLVKNAGITAAGAGIGAVAGLAVNNSQFALNKEIKKQIPAKASEALVLLAPLKQKAVDTLKSANGKAALIGTAIGAGVTVIALAAKNLMGKKQAPKATQVK